jgi:hypothetical protein
VSGKGISIGSFVSGLLFVGLEGEIQREGVWVEGKETQLSDTGVVDKSLARLGRKQATATEDCDFRISY